MHCTSLLLFASLSNAAFLGHRRQPANIKLMPLGDSITAGYQSSDGNGYRKGLYDLLTKEGHRVDMVGALKDGNMADPDHEGWGGYRIADVNAKASLDAPSRQPTVYTVDLGTNDADGNYEMSGIGGRMNATIENLWSMTPSATIILSTLTTNGNEGREPRVLQANTAYRALVKERQAAGKKIVLAEFHGSNGPQHPQDLADSLHPNDKGYAILANIWFNSIKEAESKGFL